MNKGNYYKYKSKKWLKDRGWTCEYLEQYHSFKIGGKQFLTKRDLFGTDILAMNGKEIMFVQVKLNRKHIAEAHKEFEKYPFPPFVRRVVMVWTPRHEPSMEDVP